MLMRFIIYENFPCGILIKYAGYLLCIQFVYCMYTCLLFEKYYIMRFKLCFITETSAFTEIKLIEHLSHNLIIFDTFIIINYILFKLLWK